VKVLERSLGYAGVALLGAALLLAVYAVAGNPNSLPYRYWSKYVAYLERKLRNMFLFTSGNLIARIQLGAIAFAVGVALYTGLSTVYLFVPAIAVAPALYIERLRQNRLKAIEAKMDGFILTLANALKSTPSIGNALAYSQPLLSAPLDEEVALALKEMRVGNTVDQALLNMSSRIQSVELDATLSSILIGRQVGGNLTSILETTAATLREIARLQGVVRAKTAEGRAQLGVLAVFPALMLVLFDTVSPGYFTPLTESAIGYIILSIAGVLWIASLVVARKVLAVDV
jgi:tight adherence protein B